MFSLFRTSLSHAAKLNVPSDFPIVVASVVVASSVQGGYALVSHVVT